MCGEIIALYEGRERDKADEPAVTIFAQIARKTVPYTDGLHLMAPFKRDSLIMRIMENLENAPPNIGTILFSSSKWLCTQRLKTFQKGCPYAAV